MTKNRIVPTRRTMITASVVTAVAISLAPTASAFAAETTAAPVSSISAAVATPSDVLAGTPWETTGAVDQDENNVPLTDENVANFVGWAYYNTDGTFTMYNLDDTPKMQGDWTVSADGSERILLAKDTNGDVLFERAVPITELTPEEFTYRVIPDEANPEVYYDIIHTPTDHAEPAATAPDDSEAASDDEDLAETGNAGPIVALAAGLVALVGGVAIYVTRRMRPSNQA
ncbi:DUF4822 domain-containing protein [Microbacterium sp. A94]|uniref:DUF4822 domain-containing protein n=1 Tax=Microbacterium sp. A94 TaxID=3450717 RepID=UPI003F43F766